MYCRTRKFNAKSEIRVNNADFEVGKMIQIIKEKHRPIVLSGYSLVGV